MYVCIECRTNYKFNFQILNVFSLSHVFTSIRSFTLSHLHTQSHNNNVITMHCYTLLLLLLLLLPCRYSLRSCFCLIRFGEGETERETLGSRFCGPCIFIWATNECVGCSEKYVWNVWNWMNMNAGKLKSKRKQKKVTLISQCYSTC